eukprot:scaffold11364_cov18-Tisochrysis_lutea.AAC.1
MEHHAPQEMSPSRKGEVNRAFGRVITCARHFAWAQHPTAATPKARFSLDTSTKPERRLNDLSWQLSPFVAGHMGAAHNCIQFWVLPSEDTWHEFELGDR